MRNHIASSLLCLLYIFVASFKFSCVFAFSAASRNGVVDTSGTPLFPEEAILARRGLLEEELMSHAPQSPIQSPPLLTVDGSSSSSSNTAATQTYIRALLDEGVVRVDDVLDEEKSDILRDQVFQLRDLAMNEKDNGSKRFAKVLLNSNRCDLLLPLNESSSSSCPIGFIVQDALQQVLWESPVGAILESIFGPKALLYELSCLISDPASQRQNVHPDHPCDGEDPKLYTCFIALQDIDENMGPTIWLPKTHKDHEQFQSIRVEDPMDGMESPKDRFLRTTPHVVGLVPKGSCVIFDSRLLHCGTANRSDPQNDNTKSRALFYFSFKNPQIGFPGNTGSLGYGLEKADVTLDQFKQ